MGTTDVIRKPSNHLFYGQTTSLCETCLALVPTKILIDGDNQVFFQKRCRQHGVQKTLISSDADYYRRQKEYLKPGDRPLQIQTKTDFGCPLDCGLCADHEQHSCLALIEINQACNLNCPVCFAESATSKIGQRSLEEIESMLDTLVASEGEPDLLQISGGEPTIHPQFFEILDACKRRPIRHLMINTNGVRIAKDPEFAKRLADYMPGFEVYLQFDSLRRDALIDLRGADLRTIRDQALARLEKMGLSTTLVVTVKRGVNDDECGEIVRHALKYRCVRGVTFQPVQDTGRNDNFDKQKNRLTLTDVRFQVAETSGVFDASDMIPLPCNPESICIGYGLRNGDQVAPITGMFPADVLAATVPNTVTFEGYPELRKAMFNLLSLSTAAADTSEKLASVLCCLPQADVPASVTYENTFRVVIIQFMDKYNFCVGSVKRSCVHFVEPDGKIYPFDTFNLFYRDKNVVERLRENVT
ncbi:MAG: radical SAM protein [Alphaproteobacteria bacterium]|nr:radical SAM protein [Alphaproteobacteria bacterium]